MYSIKILQNMGRDVFNSSALIFPNKTYLFNCSDGLQRNANDQNIKFNKIFEIFYSSANIETYPGTYGLIMSRTEQLTEINEAKGKLSREELKRNFNDIKRVRLYGPKGLSLRFKDCKGFFNEKMILNDVNEYDDKCNKEYKDENIRIFTIESYDLYDKQAYEGNYNLALSYFCIPHIKPRPFLAEKALELGIKPGPKYSELLKGKSVYNDSNDKLIQPNDVLGKQTPSAAIGYLYLPTVEHAKVLYDKLSKQKNFKLSNSKTSEEDYYFSVVIHIVNKSDVLLTEVYKNIINLFHPTDTIHIFDCIDTNVKLELNENKLKMKYILNIINSDLFKLGDFSENDVRPITSLNEVLSMSKEEMINRNYFSCVSGMEYLLSPIKNSGFISKGLYSISNTINKSQELNDYMEGYLYYNTKRFETFKLSIDKLNLPSFFDFEKNNQILLNSSQNKSFHDPILTFLGTISMKPSSHRNVSSILIDISNKCNLLNCFVLLDCGEGSYQQIYSHCGFEKTSQIIKDLKVVFITHKHGDHMLGLPKILKEKDNFINSSDKSDILYIISPKNCMKWVKNIVDSLKNSNHFMIINCQDINPSGAILYNKYISQTNPYFLFKDVELKSHEEIGLSIKEYKSKIKKFTDISSFYTFLKQFNIEIFSIEVFHCDDSFGCILQSDGFDEMKEDQKNMSPRWKISYSGDTRPCNNFINYAYLSTGLIHEATFDNELHEQAKVKFHTSFKEAVSVGLTSQSWRTILTHFSPRYMKESPWEEEFKINKVLIANDYLNVRLSQLNNAYLYGEMSNKVFEYLNMKAVF